MYALEQLISVEKRHGNEPSSWHAAELDIFGNALPRQPEPQVCDGLATAAEETSSTLQAEQM